MVYRKYASLEDRKEATRRRRNQRRNGDDIERPRGRPWQYATVEEAKAAKLENQRFWRQVRKEEELKEQQGYSSPASETAVPKRRVRKYATETEARSARNARRREIYQASKVNPTAAQSINQGSSQSDPENEKDASSACVKDSVKIRGHTQRDPSDKVDGEQGSDASRQRET